MKLLLIVIIALLVLYSLGLGVIEYKFGQPVVRHFFTDITGPSHKPVMFYGINTTLTVFLLWATSLLFFVSYVITGKSEYENDKRFYLSQTIVFAFLGFDDRFLIHEKIGETTGINDALLLLIIGVAEVVLILWIGRIMARSREIQLCLLLSSLLFGLMIFIDGFLPPGMLFRLSAEDLSKTWACFFLFLYSWNILMSQILKPLSARRG